MFNILLKLKQITIWHLSKTAVGDVGRTIPAGNAGVICYVQQDGTRHNKTEQVKVSQALTEAEEKHRLEGTVPPEPQDSQQVGSFIPFGS